MSDSYRQAMSRLVFYINRAGSKLAPLDARRLEAAKTQLHRVHKREAHDYWTLHGHS